MNSRIVVKYKQNNLLFHLFYCKSNPRRTAYSPVLLSKITPGVQQTLLFLLFSCQKQNTRRSADSPVSPVLLSKTKHQAFSGLSCFTCSTVKVTSGVQRTLLFSCQKLHRAFSRHSCFSCSPVKNKAAGVQRTLLFLLFSCQKPNTRRSVDSPVSPVLLSKT